jgi:hypothetical protein
MTIERMLERLGKAIGDLQRRMGDLDLHYEPPADADFRDMPREVDKPLDDPATTESGDGRG